MCKCAEREEPDSCATRHARALSALWEGSAQTRKASTAQWRVTSIGRTGRNRNELPWKLTRPCLPRGHWSVIPDDGPDFAGQSGGRVTHRSLHGRGRAQPPGLTPEIRAHVKANWLADAKRADRRMTLMADARLGTKFTCACSLYGGACSGFVCPR